MDDQLEIITGASNINLVTAFMQGKINDIRGVQTTKKLREKGHTVPDMPKLTADEAIKQYNLMIESLSQVRGIYDLMEKNLLLARQRNFEDYKLRLEMQKEIKELKEQNKNLMDGLN